MIQEGANTETSTYRASPVDRVRQPIRNFSETKKYQDILSYARSKTTLILHCHGVPGSGKSEIIRKLAEQFPYEETKPELYVKWHIQCIDSSHDVKTELKCLVQELYENSLMHRSLQNQVQNILKSIDENMTGKLACTLRNLNLPVLIIIEDVKPERDKFLEDFFRSVDGSKEKNETCFHIYMTTRQKRVVLSKGEWEKISNYKVEAIQGFNKDEGVSFLLDGMACSQEDRDSAEEVYGIFSGSPLGLRAAKTYCQDTRLSYRDYLKWLKNYCKDNTQHEDDDLFEEYGSKVLNVFQAIAKPFHVSEGQDREAKLTWKVLSCLTHFHYDRIPQVVLQQCCQELRETPVKDVGLCNRKESGRIISRLLDHEMCTETDEKDITFHEVVMRAFRHDHMRDKDQEKLSSLKTALFVVARIITKDMREKQNSRTMGKLVRHVDSVLKHVEGQQDFFNGSEGRLISLITSHVYETFGAIALHKARHLFPDCDQYFKKALKVIWKEDEPYSLDNPVEESVENVARYVVEKCQLAGENLPENFTTAFESRIRISLKGPLLSRFEESMKQHHEFSSLHDLIDSMAPHDFVASLCHCGLFLSDRDHRNVFFADRIASILHSWSRAILPRHKPNPEEYNRYIWFSSLSRAISTECRKRYNVGLLTEHISVIGGMIPLILEQKPEIEALLDAKAKCEEALLGKPNEVRLYEHGLLKNVGPSDEFIKIKMHRNLVRIYARLITKPGGSRFISEGNEKVKILYELATSSACRFSKALMCIVYCGKYYAASKNFGQCISCFRVYFDKSNSIPQTRNVHCWATYNYARAVLLSGNREERTRAIVKCEEVTGALIDFDLNDKLNEVLEKLKR